MTGGETVPPEKADTFDPQSRADGRAEVHPDFLPGPGPLGQFLSHSMGISHTPQRTSRRKEEAPGSITVLMQVGSC